MPSILAQICNLTVRYLSDNGNEVLALDDVSLCISDSEIVAVVGESGSGKSTLAAAIMRLLPPNAEYRGSVLFANHNLATLDERRLRKLRGAKLSLIPQDPAVSLNPVLRVGTQISEVLRAHLGLNRRERENRVYELLKEVGLDNPERIASSYPHQISGGERQRVAIAQAIACHPLLIIADEPTSKLDSPLQTQILSLMSGIVRRHGTALLWITHDPSTLPGFADRIAVMHTGKVVEEGRTREILSQPEHTFTRALVQLSQEFAIALTSDSGRTQNVF